MGKKGKKVVDVYEEHRNMNKEAITAEYARLEEEIEKLKKAKESVAYVKQTYNYNDRKRAAIYGSFIMKNHKDEYERTIKGKEFDIFLNRNIDRELFGIYLLPTIEITEPEKFTEILKKHRSIDQGDKKYNIPHGMTENKFREELKEYEDEQKKKEEKTQEDKPSENK